MRKLVCLNVYDFVYNLQARRVRNPLISLQQLRSPISWTQVDGLLVRTSPRYTRLELLPGFIPPWLLVVHPLLPGYLAPSHLLCTAESFYFWLWLITHGLSDSFDAVSSPACRYLKQGLDHFRERCNRYVILPPFSVKSIQWIACIYSAFRTHWTKVVPLERKRADHCGGKANSEIVSLCALIELYIYIYKVRSKQQRGA